MFEEAYMLDGSEAARTMLHQQESCCNRSAVGCDGDGTCADSEFDNGGVNLLQKEIRLTSIAEKVEAGINDDTSAETRLEKGDSAKPTMIPLQNYHATTYDRYPTIFRRLKELLPSGKPGLKLLSFGCSYGAEVRTLRRDFPNADIDGVDIASEVIEKNKAKNKDEKVHYYDNVAKLEDGSYDAVLLMGVLCNENKSSTHLAHGAFVGALDAVDKLVRPGGLVVVYNADYPFSEYTRSARYVNKCSQLVSTVQSVSAADVKYDRPQDKDVKWDRPKEVKWDPSRGMCSVTDRSCIESGWGNKFNVRGEMIQPYGRNTPDPDDPKKEIKMSPGCKFPGVFFERLSEGAWPADEKGRSAVVKKKERKGD